MRKRRRPQPWHFSCAWLCRFTQIALGGRSGRPRRRSRGAVVHPDQCAQRVWLAFTPTADGTAVEFSGQGRLDPILAGVTEAWTERPKGGVSPTHPARSREGLGAPVPSI